MADYNPAPDLSSHATVPSASLIDAIISKPVKEQQMGLAAEANRRKRIQDIFGAIEQGQRIAANSIELAQKRQAIAAEQALAKHTDTLFRQGSNATTKPIQQFGTETKLMPSKIGSPTVPTAQYDPATNAVKPNSMVADLASGIMQYAPKQVAVPTVQVQPTFGQTQAGAQAKASSMADLARTAALVAPQDTAGNINKMLYPDQDKTSFNSPIPVVNRTTGERSFLQANKNGTLQLANGQSYSPEWIRDYALGAGTDQFGNPIVIDKAMNQGRAVSTGSGGGESGIPALQAQAPKLAERFVEARGQAYPQNNKALATYTESVAGARGIKEILSQPGEINGVALQSLGFYFARAAGSNSQLSDAERENFQEPLALLDRITNKGYKLGAGDLSPKMRRDLTRLAEVYERKGLAQGNRMILSAKRNAAAQVGNDRFKKLQLGKEFPTMDELSINAGDFNPQKQDGGGIQVDMSALDAELAKRGLK